MEKFVLLRHGDLKFNSEKDIISIKQQHWDYPYSSQKEWLNMNLKEDDIHLMLYLEGQLTAYLNLVNVSIDVDNNLIRAIGLGNVCVTKCKTGNGYGRKIVQKANEIIKEKNRTGILLCKEGLVQFYTLLGWQNLRSSQIYVAERIYDKIIMTYNSSINNVDKLVIDRNF